MKINADKPHLWKEDVKKSVDLYNDWFINFAPKTYKETRIQTTGRVKMALDRLGDLRDISAKRIIDSPSILQILRMCTAPPLAVDRLIGLSQVNPSLVRTLETGKIPARASSEILEASVGKMADIITKLIDSDLFPWLETKNNPSTSDLLRASTIIADRLTGAVADPIVRNAQEKRQLKVIETFLTNKGYFQKQPDAGKTFKEMEVGTFAFRLNIPVGSKVKVNIPIDVVIQSKVTNGPVLIEAKSAGDFTNTNKRRKEEATKIHQLRLMYGDKIKLYLFLCGYFDTGYLGYEAAEGLDWVWEHKLDDLEALV